MEAQLKGFGARRDVVRSAESGKEVVQRGFVRKVDHGEPQTPLVTVSVEEIVLSHAGVKQAARRDALRIVVVVLFPWRRHLEVYGSQPGRIARGKCRSKGAWSGKLDVASEPGLKLLISSQGQPSDAIYQGHLVWPEVGIGVCSPSCNRCCSRACCGCSETRQRASDEAAVISPIERDPRQALKRLVLHMCRLVEDLVMVDAEHAVPHRDNRYPSDLRQEESCRHAGHGHEGGEPMVVRHAHADRVSRDLVPLPFDRKG